MTPPHHGKNCIGIVQLQCRCRTVRVCQIQNGGKKIWYTQGDLGLWQCARPCHSKTYDNEERLREMLAHQEGMRIPERYIPRCPLCGGEMDFNLYWDDRFVRDAGCYEAHNRYLEYLKQHTGQKVLFLELGVGFNSPGVIKYPFYRHVQENPNAFFVTVDVHDPCIMNSIADRALAIEADIDRVLTDLLEQRHG